MRHIALLLVGLALSCSDAPAKRPSGPAPNNDPANNGSNNGATNNGATNNGTSGQSCGDGVLDPGELCDSGITDGQGACPQSCAAPACHVATLAGSPSTCNAACVVEPVDCADGDGCCSVGCDAATDSDCTNVCGDGVVDANELCDGNCPTSCGTPSACSLVALTGAPDRCNAQCEETPVTICQGGDGCCPTDCNANNDPDCGATCGNGTLEPGESCDGGCPTSCDDGVACTRDSFAGSPDTCNVVCANSEIRVCQGGDGCCPAGCVRATDSDCSASCGDGVVDAGETCDGNCPTSCNDQDACTRDTFRGAASSCTAECLHSRVTVCQSGDGCCPSGCTNANDNDCSCTPDTCSSLGLECGSADNGCGGTMQCGTCATGTCTSGMCDDGQQEYVIGTPCTSDSDCVDATFGTAMFCFTAADGYPGGYCSADCQFICTDFVSVCASDPALLLVGSCHAPCASNDDCRTGYVCELVYTPAGDLKACIPQ